jgi:hypothetical protein
MTVVNGTRLFLLGLWLGAALFFSAVVAPTVFSVLHSFHLANANEIAGTIVTRTLSVINVGGFLIGLLSLAAILIFKRNVGRGLFAVEVVSLMLLVITTAVGQWVIAARMLALRAAMVMPIDQVTADDPRRIAFNSLHHYSVVSLGVAILAVIVAMIVIMKRSCEKID